MVIVHKVGEDKIKTSQYNYGISIYEHPLKTVYGSLYGEEYNIENVNTVFESILNKIDLNELMDLDVYVIPMKMHLYVDDYSLGSLYYGQAFYEENVIFSGAVNSKDDLQKTNDTLIHEVGHFVTNMYIVSDNDKYNEFKKIINKHDDESILWSNRPKEFLAEHFTKIINKDYEVKTEYNEECLQFIKDNIPMKKEVIEMNTPEMIIIHHAAGINFSYEQCKEYHKSLGWGTCGYHYYIQKNLDKFRAREEHEVGAHTKGYNLKSIGICLEGHYDQEHPTDDILNKLAETIFDIRTRYGNLPLHFHREFANKTCPGTNFPSIEDIEKRVKAMSNTKTWQEETLDELVKDELIKSPEYWLEKWEENIKVKDVIGLVGNLILRSKGE